MDCQDEYPAIVNLRSVLFPQGYKPGSADFPLPVFKPCNATSSDLDSIQRTNVQELSRSTLLKVMDHRSERSPEGTILPQRGVGVCIRTISQW